jgi:phospholipid transport system transporter-binding protein
MTELCSIEIQPDGNAGISGELTFESVPGLFREAAPLFAHAPAVPLIDLAEVTAVDSAGLALLLEWQANRKASNTPFRVVNAPPSLISLAQLADATDLLELSGRAPQS